MNSLFYATRSHLAADAANPRRRPYAAAAPGYPEAAPPPPFAPNELPSMHPVPSLHGALERGPAPGPGWDPQTPRTLADLLKKPAGWRDIDPGIMVGPSTPGGLQGRDPGIMAGPSTPGEWRDPDPGIIVDPQAGNWPESFQDRWARPPLPDWLKENPGTGDGPGASPPGEAMPSLTNDLLFRRLPAGPQHDAVEGRSLEELLREGLRRGLRGPDGDAGPLAIPLPGPPTPQTPFTGPVAVPLPGRPAQGQAFGHEPGMPFAAGDGAVMTLPDRRRPGNPFAGEGGAMMPLPHRQRPGQPFSEESALTLLSDHGQAAPVAVPMSAPAPGALPMRVPDFHNAPGVQFAQEADGSFTGVVTTNPYHVLWEAQDRGFKALGHGYLGSKIGNWVRFAPADLAPMLQKGPYRPQEASVSNVPLVTLASAPGPGAMPLTPSVVPGAPMAGLRDGNDFGGAFADSLTEMSPELHGASPIDLMSSQAAPPVRHDEPEDDPFVAALKEQIDQDEQAGHLGQSRINGTHVLMDEGGQFWYVKRRDKGATGGGDPHEEPPRLITLSDEERRLYLKARAEGRLPQIVVTDQAEAARAAQKVAGYKQEMDRLAASGATPAQMRAAYHQMAGLPPPEDAYVESPMWAHFQLGVPRTLRAVTPAPQGGQDGTEGGTVKPVLRAGGHWRLEDLPALYNDPAFKAASHPERQQVLEQVLRIAQQDQVRAAGGRITREQHVQFREKADAARAQVAGMETWKDNAEYYGGVVGNAALGTARAAIAGSADMSRYEPDGTPRQPGGNIIEQGGYWVQKLADSAETKLHPAPELDAALEALKKDLDEGNLPLGDASMLSDWLQIRSDLISAHMSRWYDGIAGPSPEGKWKRGYEQVNGLLNPLHAHLLGRYLETRDPAVWEALVKSLKKTPWRAEIEHAQKGSLERSQIVGFLTDAMGGGDYAEHMIAAGDPVQLLMTVLPALRGLGVVGGVAKGGLKAGAKGLTTSALIGGGMGLLNTVVQDPHATWEDYQRAAKEGIAAALGLHAGGKVLKETLGKVVDRGSEAVQGKIISKIDRGTRAYLEKFVQLKGAQTKPGGVVIASAASGYLGQRLKYEDLSSPLKELYDKMPKSGDTVVVPKNSVTLAQLRTLGRVSGDEYSVFTLKGKRLIIRGYGQDIKVSDEMNADLLAGAYGIWSGHTHPPGYEIAPSIIDRNFLTSMPKRKAWNETDNPPKSAIWGDADAPKPFGPLPTHDDQIRTDINKRKWMKHLQDEP